MTKAEMNKELRNTINNYKDETFYFNGSISEQDMFEMLRYRMGFGNAETEVIISALKLVGAKFN